MLLFKGRNTTFYLTLFSIIFLAISNAAEVEVSIPKIFNGTISAENINVTSNVIDFLYEFHNSGSVPYNAKLRVDVYDESDLIFTGWRQSLRALSNLNNIT